MGNFGFRSMASHAKPRMHFMKQVAIQLNGRKWHVPPEMHTHTHEYLQMMAMWTSELKAIRCLLWMQPVQNTTTAAATAAVAYKLLTHVTVIRPESVKIYLIKSSRGAQQPRLYRQWWRRCRFFGTRIQNKWLQQCKPASEQTKADENNDQSKANQKHLTARSTPVQEWPSNIATCICSKYFLYPLLL